MAIITISKQYASGGVELAETLAQSLGYRLVGRSVLGDLAQRMDRSEAEVELLSRGRGTRWLSLVDKYLLHTVQKIIQKPEAALDDHAYFQAVKKLLEDLAQEGNAVILGWGAQVILQGHPETLHLRVVAPQEERADRLAQASGSGKAQALAQCQRQDHNSSSYVHHYLGADWNDPELYHMVLNLGKMAYDLEKAQRMVQVLL